jgi:anthranilate synthase component 1
MEIIDELETTRRGTLRRVYRLLRRGRGHGHRHRDPHGAAARRHGACPGRAGIVADSDPAAEDEECQNKAAAVLRALAIAEELA